MNELEKKHIVTNLSELVIKTSWRTSCKIVPIENNVFGEDDVAELESILNERERIFKFYEIFMKRKDSYPHLITTLEKGCQSGAVEILNRFDANLPVAGRSTAQVSVGIRFDIRQTGRLFTGRLKELTSLHNKLIESKSKSTVISQVASIVGLGGIGKTELARMYIKEFGENYDNNVIWISAETEETLGESFRRLATDYLKISLLNVDGKEKHIKSLVEEVYKFFKGKLCLFVFDNAESNEDIIKFLPLHVLDPPYVLITSRDKDWKFSVEMVELNEMTELEAVEFVKNGLEIKDEKQDDVVVQLVKTLQFFPLAISQAISYIKQQQIIKVYNMCEYLEEYKSCLKKLLCYKVPSAELNSYAKTTFSTWKLTVDLLSKNNECGKVAVCLLNMIAYFESDKIPTKLLLTSNLETLQFAAASEAGILSCVAELFGLSKIVVSLKPPSSTLNFCEKIEKALQLLAKYSLINLQPSDETISIHRLVQEVTRIDLREKKLEEETLKNALRLLSEDLDLKTISHFCSTYKYCGEYQKLVVDFKQVPWRVMEKLDEDVSSGRYSAVRIGNELKETLQKHVSLEDPDVARLEYRIAVANYRVGNFEIATTAFENFLPTYMENKDGMFTKTEILILQHVLADSLNALEKRSESLTQLLQTYKSLKTLYGVNNCGTIQSLVQIAECLQNLDHFKKPFSENTRIQVSTQDQELILPDPQEIILLLKAAYENSRHMFCTDIKHTRNISKIASFFEAIGDHDTAITILNDVFKQAKDSDNTNVKIELIWNLNVRGILVGNEGECKDALGIGRDDLISLLKAAYENDKHLISTDHNHASNMSLIAYFLREIEDKDTASTVANDVYKQGRNSNDPMVQFESIKCLNLLGILKYDEGKHHEALNIFGETYAFSLKALGDSHSNTLLVKANMFEMLGCVGEGETALSGLREVLKALMITYPNHEYGLSVAFKIGTTLLEMKRYDESLAWLVDLRKRLDKRFDHNYRLISKLNNWTRKLQNVVPENV